ncbi:MAG: hypothetical protein VKJ09_15595 [Leptolyngbya sp.]|nr:hypothetical protein [Leptolyngbya sp.]
MNHEKALQEINKRIGKGKGCLFENFVQLADHIGTSPQAVGSFLNGNQSPLPESILAAFGMTRSKKIEYDYRFNDAPITYKRVDK